MSEMTLFDALNALKGLPKNAPEAEIEKAELEVLEAKKRATHEERERAKKEYAEYNHLLNDPISFDQNTTSVLNAIRDRTKSKTTEPHEEKKPDGSGGGSGATPS